MPEISAYRAEHEERLTYNQRRRLSHLVKGILDAVREYLRERPDCDVDHLRIRRPHNVFCIDGGRGAGKTHVLLTLEHILQQMMTSRSVASAEALLSVNWKSVVERKQWTELLDATRTAAGDFAPIMPLRIIFPADLTNQEFVMEALFAALRQDIDEHLKDKTLSDKRRKEGETLRKELVQDVARGQYYARRFGLDTVLRDSLSFGDLVTKFDDLNAVAAGRTEAWRAFVEKYLDWRQVCTLAILLDDSDLRPEVTNDILQTARSMFSHPRLITVIAGNSRSMRNSLLSLTMRDLASIMPALNQREHPTGKAWRRDERLNIEQVMEKLLPASKRFFLMPPAPADFNELIGQPLHMLVADALADRRDSFMRAKMFSGFAIEVTGTDLHRQTQIVVLEDYMSWWLFQSKYGAQLRPLSARQAITFKSYFDLRDKKPSEPVSPLDDRRLAKRLPVVLFENSTNYALIQRLGDGDGHTTEWLSRQDLESQWGERRAFVINGHRIEAGTYTHDFISFRLDLGLALPLRDNPDKLVPSRLLPLVSGRKRIRQFYRPYNMPQRPRRLGLSHWLDHSAIPGNCIYFHNLNALPTSSFVPDIYAKTRDEDARVGKGGEWEAELHAAWPELLERDQDERIQQYLTEVFGDLKRPRSGSPEEIAEHYATAKLVETLVNGSKDEDWHYTSFLRDEARVRAGVANKSSLRPREDAAYEAFLASSIATPGGFILAPNRQLTPSLYPRDKQAIARLSALVSDLRRSWHAIRIWESSRGVGPDEATHGQSARSMLTTISTNDRMRLYTLEELQTTLEADVWLRGVLEIFGKLRSPVFQDQIRPAINEHLSDFLQKLGVETKPPLAAFLDRIEPTTADGSAAPDEIDVDAAYWTSNWRDLGRRMCTHWPIGGGTEIVSLLFGKKREPGETPEPGEALKPGERPKWGYRIIIEADAVDGRDPWEVQKAQSARAFIFLLYGLTPGLPAMIHAHVVSLLRPADRESPKAALRALRAWGELIVQFQAIARYVKYKLLTLYVVSTLHHLRKNPELVTQVKGAGETVQHARSRQIEEFIETVLADAGLTEEERRPLRPFVEFIEATWSYFVPDAHRVHGTDPLSRDLNIMPDASPSALFGERWFRDVLARSLRKEGTHKEVVGQGVSYEGMFGEIERWLWASHRMARTAWATLADEFPEAATAVLSENAFPGEASCPAEDGSPPPT